MTKAKSDISNVQNDMEGLLRQVHATLESSSGVWKGDAQVAFAKVTQDYNDAARKMNTGLIDMVSKLSSSLNKYGHQESETTHAVTTAGGSLNMNQ
ncbi:WXG100 family type VII secretion target [Gordonia sp. X0973]|nr:WXG100 family type VII secretion target [Gordonia sp. X0973]